MHPIARGTAPLVVTVLAALVHERPGAWQLAGIALASSGLLGVALWGIRAGRGADGQRERPAQSWASRQLPVPTAAVATGLAISAYTVVDGMGVRAAGTPVGYAGWLVMLMGPFIPLYALAVRGTSVLRQLRPVAGRGLLGGALSTGAYGLVL